jgi:drug/metabolite transporter (DMT)-like permease
MSYLAAALLKTRYACPFCLIFVADLLGWLSLFLGGYVSDSSRQAPVWVSDLLLLLVAIVWGTSYGLAKQSVVLYPVLGFLAIRFGMTFVLLLPTLRKLGSVEGRNALRAGLPLGLILLAIFMAETFGVMLTRASNAAFLISLCVVFTPFVEWMILARRPENRAFMATGLSLLGAILLTSGISFDLNVGDWLILLAAVLRAFMVVMTKKLTINKAMSSLALTAIQSGVVGLGSLLAAMLFLPSGLPSLPTSAVFWGNTVYLVLFCTIFAFFAQNFSVRRSNPTRVSVLMGSEPVFGALFAVIWLGEQLSFSAWAGGALIVAASLWVTLPRRRDVKLASAN